MVIVRGFCMLVFALFSLPVSAQNQGYLGISVHPDPRGVLVVDVESGSAAEAAGLLVNDLVLEVEGHSLEGKSRRYFVDLLQGFAAGDHMKVVIERIADAVTERLEKTVTLGNRPQEATQDFRRMRRNMLLEEGSQEASTLFSVDDELDVRLGTTGLEVRTAGSGDSRWTKASEGLTVFLNSFNPVREDLNRLKPGSVLRIRRQYQPEVGRFEVMPVAPNKDGARQP